MRGKIQEGEINYFHFKGIQKILGFCRVLAIPARFHH